MRARLPLRSRLLTATAVGRQYSMADARPFLLALALEAAPLGAVRLARSAWRRSAYVASLVEPDDYEPAGFVETESGIDVLWRYCGNPRLAGG